MKKWLLCLMFMVTLAGISTISTISQAEEVSNEAKVELTEEQKEEMAKLHKDILEKKKEVITKYVQYGVFTEEKGKKITSMFDKHYIKLEQNGFIPKWDGERKHHHKE
ncbi:YckD family protein [Halalkalibacter kiskunsagensis]|uniref:YckD family protein n=1 Tax=Halalkalibacter kiskunsagensis TaxID=1548599 RepID=A0ABV6KBC0_9BACI